MHSLNINFYINFEISSSVKPVVDFIISIGISFSNNFFATDWIPSFILLMMFYTTIAGWLLYYCYAYINGSLANLDVAEVGNFFGALTANPGKQILWMAIGVVFSFTVVGIGLQKGVEKITKVMMILLLLLIVVLAIHSVALPGSSAGVKFYLLPDFSKMKDSGFTEVIFAAMGQAFFTLSLGIGAMEIFGSYIDKKFTLTGESLKIILLDNFVAITSGLIIFPACFAYGVNPDAGPQLLFITMPNIFNNMSASRFWGALFFVFMSFAAISTLIGVFENIVSYWIDVENVVPSYYAKHPGTWLIQMYYKNPINSNTMDCIGSKYIELK